MLNVGLTGNVASGKSTVSRHFARWGATLLDADALVRDVQRPGSSVLTALADRFGVAVLRPDGTLDRGALRRLMLADDAARADLNAIVHPAVRQRRAELLAAARARGDLVVVSDIPLLFEVLDPDDFDLVVLVDAAEGLRRRRLMHLRAMDPDEAERLIRVQLPTEQKRERSDLILDNSADLPALEHAARTAWSEIRRTAASRATLPGTHLLVVVAHGDDAHVLLPGTLERYRDAGVLITLWCATEGPRPDVPAGVRVVRIDRRRGVLERDDPDAIAALSRAVTDTPPAAVIGIEPHGGDGHPDHRVVMRWTATALQSTDLSCPVYHAIPPGPRLATERAGVAVALDVRPWLTESVRIAPCGLRVDHGTVAAPWNGREWFVARGGSGPLSTDVIPLTTAG